MTGKLLEVVLSIIPVVLTFLLTYYVKGKAKREAILAKSQLVLQYADMAVKAAEDLLGPKTGFDKLKYAIEILQKILKEVGINLSKEEAEAAVRSAYQTSPYNKTS
jgi:hypothetical protein